MRSQLEEANFIETEKYDVFGREKMDPRPVSVHLGKKPRKLSIGDQVRLEIQRELARKEARDHGEASIPVFGHDDEDLDADDDFGQSPHEVVIDPGTGEVSTRGDVALAQANAEFDAELNRRREALRRSKALQKVQERQLKEEALAAAKQTVAEATVTPAEKPASEPQPASGGVRGDARNAKLDADGYPI